MDAVITAFIGRSMYNCMYNYMRNCMMQPSLLRWRWPPTPSVSSCSDARRAPGNLGSQSVAHFMDETLALFNLSLVKGRLHRWVFRVPRQIPSNRDLVLMVRNNHEPTPVVSLPLRYESRHR